MWGRSQALRAEVTERLNEIFSLMQRMTSEYEEELSLCREEARRKQRLLDQLLSYRTDTLQTQVKEEPEEQDSEQDSELQRQRLRALVTERLAAAAEDIFTLVERTIAEYEEELCRCKEENQRKQQLLQEEPEAGSQRWDSPADEASMKLEHLEDPHRSEDLYVQVKDEDPDEVPVTVATPTYSDFTEHCYEEEHEEDHEENHEEDHMENIETWQIAMPDHEAKRIHPPRRTTKSSSRKTKKVKEPFCKACNRMLASLLELRKHRDHHAEGRHHGCPQCWKAFYRPSQVQVHMRNVHLKHRAPPAEHTKPKLFRCSMCPMTFSQSYGLKKHMYQHTGRRIYGCSTCEQSFKRKYELERHVERSHRSHGDPSHTAH